jgi:hypothetical protein
MPAMELNSEAIMYAEAAVPDEEKEYLSGLARMCAMNSFALFAGNDGCVTRANGTSAMRLTGLMSLLVS